MRSCRCGLAPFTYRISDGNLPKGLAMDSNVPLIHGTPEKDAAGKYSFLVQVTDPIGDKSEARFSLVVGNQPPLVLAENHPSGRPRGEKKGKAAAGNEGEGKAPGCSKPIVITNGLHAGSTTIQGTATPSHGSMDVTMSMDVVYGVTNHNQALSYLKADNNTLSAGVAQPTPIPLKLRPQSDERLLGNRMPRNYVFRSAVPPKNPDGARVGSNGAFTLELSRPLDSGGSVVLTQHGCADTQPARASELNDDHSESGNATEPHLETAPSSHAGHLRGLSLRYGDLSTPEEMLAHKDHLAARPASTNVAFDRVQHLLQHLCPLSG